MQTAVFSCSHWSHVYSDNSTSSCVGEVYITTHLNSTDLLLADWLYAATGSVALPIIGDSWVASVSVSIATQLHSTSSRVCEVSIATRWRNSTSSSVELCRYKRAFKSLASRYHSLTNRHNCSTPETQDRKCFSMQLILVVGLYNLWFWWLAK